MIEKITLAMLVALIMVLTSIALIWSLNTLFPMLAIPYNLNTLAAAFILLGSTQLNYRKK